jgi:hypothetical protein
MGELGHDSTIPDLDTRWRCGQLHALAALSRENSPGTPWIEGWVGPEAGLDNVEWRKISCPCRQSNPGIQIVAHSYTD